MKVLSKVQLGFINTNLLPIFSAASTQMLGLIDDAYVSRTMKPRARTITSPSWFFYKTITFSIAERKPLKLV